MLMEDQKVENLLYLALNTDEAQRERSLNLNVGYDDVGKSWELIIRYSGNLDTLSDAGITVVYLMNNYAILTVPENLLDFVTTQPQIEYIEKPKRLFFADTVGRQASCITTVQSGPAGLSGRGVIVALIDSGIDYTHPDFRRADGRTRILALWDQTVSQTPEVIGENGENVVLGPPKGYYRGVL